jgi:hypothetical protein
MSYMAIERESSEEDNSGNHLLSLAHGTGSTNNKKRKSRNNPHRDDE